MKKLTLVSDSSLNSRLFGITIFSTQVLFLFLDAVQHPHCTYLPIFFVSSDLCELSNLVLFPQYVWCVHTCMCVHMSGRLNVL